MASALEASSGSSDEELSAAEEAEDSQHGDDQEDKDDVRKELSSLSFEELQELKERLGTKNFAEAVHSRQRTERKEISHRANKNRPRELSSKIAPSKYNKEKVKKQEIRDPRFDERCGEFDRKYFRKNYEFVNSLKYDELTKLKAQLKEEPDEKQKTKIKYLIQRLGNQLKESKKHKEEEGRLVEEKKKRSEDVAEGKIPFYVKKADQRLMDLASKYEALKGSGGIDKYLQKKRKRNAARDRKSLPDVK